MPDFQKSTVLRANDWQDNVRKQRALGPYGLMTPSFLQYLSIPSTYMSYLETQATLEFQQSTLHVSLDPIQDTPLD